MLRLVFFRKNKNPRFWVQSFLFSRNYQLRSLFLKIGLGSWEFFRKNFQPWHQGVLANPYPESDWVNEKNCMMSECDFSTDMSIEIITPKSTTFVALFIQSWIFRSIPRVSIKNEMPDQFDADMYFVVCPQVFSILPPPSKRIAVQMEQTISHRWFTREYLGILFNSLAVIDYSKTNIRYLSSLSPPIGRLVHVPIGPVDVFELSRYAGRAKIYDVVFYGDTKIQRRKKFLSAIGQKFNLKIINGIYGEELWEVLSLAKIVVNIHYYENALLETTRIAECVSLGLKVVSEVAADQSDYDHQFPTVSFTPINDISAMLGEIDVQLRQLSDVPSSHQPPVPPVHVLDGLEAVGINFRR